MLGQWVDLGTQVRVFENEAQTGAGHFLPSPCRYNTTVQAHATDEVDDERLELLFLVFLLPEVVRVVAQELDEPDLDDALLLQQELEVELLLQLGEQVLSAGDHVLQQREAEQAGLDDLCAAGREGEGIFSLKTQLGEQLTLLAHWRVPGCAAG